MKPKPIQAWIARDTLGQCCTVIAFQNPSLRKGFWRCASGSLNVIDKNLFRLKPGQCVPVEIRRKDRE